MSNTLLPNSRMKIADGTQYEPPQWITRDFLPKLMELDEKDYINLRMWLCPMSFFVKAVNAAQNPLLSDLFERMIMEDRWYYLSQFTPPPGVKKQ